VKLQPAIFGLDRVRTGPGKPGKSWNFNIPKSRPGNPGKSILVMESHGKLKFYITLTKYFTYFNLPCSHNNNMNCYYITDFCKSEVNFVLLLYLSSLKY
jgi:hypothetical protein